MKLCTCADGDANWKIPLLEVAALSHNSIIVTKLINAASTGRLDTEEKNNVNAVMVATKSIKPSPAVNRWVMSRSILKESSTINAAPRSSIRVWKMVAPKNLPSTSCDAATGKLSRKSNRFACFSPATKCIHRSGVATIKTMLTGARKFTIR